MADIAPFHVMALLARAKALEAAGRSIIHMEVGEPDFPTAAPIIAAGQRALAEGRTRYTAATGLPELRQAISDHYRERYGVAVPARRILITPGASGALQLATAVLINPGDRVLLAGRSGLSLQPAFRAAGGRRGGGNSGRAGDRLSAYRRSGGAILGRADGRGAAGLAGQSHRHGDRAR